MTRYGTVAIVGPGLIGASVGLALRRGPWAREVVGIGRKAASVRKAASCGAVDRTTTDLERGVAGADFVVVCTPVSSIAAVVRDVIRSCPPTAMVTDAGSTKARIVQDVQRCFAAATAHQRAMFVGSHPLAGDHRAGAAFARADLFDGRVAVVTPHAHAPTSRVNRVRAFWRTLGARVLTMSPAEHDRGLAAASHVPHVVASALASATPANVLQLVAGGWRDATRIAASDPELWQQILFANRSHVLRSLNRVERNLRGLREAIDRQNTKQLVRLLSEAKRRRDAVGS